MRFLKLFSIVAFGFLLGCAALGQRPFEVAVDSLAAPAAQEKRNYILIPGNKNVSAGDLQFQEYATYVRRVLDQKGFTPAENSKHANVAVILSYGIGEPETEHYSYSLPTWGQTGVASAQTYGTATAYGNSATYSGTTTYTPTYGITGYTSHTDSRTTYFRYVILAAYDFEVFRRTEEQVELWRTTITSRGSSGDLRRVFPILMGASIPYIAKNTAGQQTVQLHEHDTSVRAVRGEPVPK